jgi:hypothetical protein
MKLTKSRLKELIKEVAQKHLPGIGDVLLSLNEIHGPDEEERREWADMIDRDISALQGTLEEASEALDGLEPHHEQLLDTLNQMGEEEDTEEEGYIKSRREAYDKEESAARREGPSTPLSSEAAAALYDDDDEDW